MIKDGIISADPSDSLYYPSSDASDKLRIQTATFHPELNLLLWEKGRDLTQSYGKSPITDRKIQKAMWQHKNATKNFDYTTIADRLM